MSSSPDITPLSFKPLWRARVTAIRASEICIILESRADKRTLCKKKILLPVPAQMMNRRPRRYPARGVLNISFFFFFFKKKKKIPRSSPRRPQWMVARYCQCYLTGLKASAAAKNRKRLSRRHCNSARASGLLAHPFIV